MNCFFVFRVFLFFGEWFSWHTKSKLDPCFFCFSFLFFLEEIRTEGNEALLCARFILCCFMSVITFGDRSQMKGRKAVTRGTPIFPVLSHYWNSIDHPQGLSWAVFLAPHWKGHIWTSCLFVKSLSRCRETGQGTLAGSSKSQTKQELTDLLPSCPWVMMRFPKSHKYLRVLFVSYSLNPVPVLRLTSAWRKLFVINYSVCVWMDGETHRR